MTRSYRWANGCRIKGNAQEVGELLDDIRKQHDGVLLARDVVDAARKKNSPLHGFFNWNDSEAAECWREEQAGHLIRSVTVFVEERQDLHVRAFVNIEGPGHVCVVEAMEDGQMRAALLKKAKAELMGWRVRYSDLEAFSEVFKAIDTIAAK